MKRPTKLRKMKLNSVDFVRNGANQAADIELYKSADYVPDDDDEERNSFFKSISDGITNVLKKAFGDDSDGSEPIDVAKAESDLTTFTDALGESFSSIMKDDTLDDSERVGMIQKSLSEFNDTLDEYISSFSILEKSDSNIQHYDPQETVNKSNSKGDAEMEITMENVDKSLLTPDEAAQLDALIAKACKTEKACGSGTSETEKACGKQSCKKENMPAGKVNPAANQEEEMENMPPEVKKAFAALQEETANLKKSMEMQELSEVAKKYTSLGKKENELVDTLYTMKSAGESVYKSYVDSLDAQLDIVEKSGMFSEIGKSFTGGYSSLAKSEPESKIEAIAKGYMDKDPTMDHTSAVAKAWENNPDLMAAYENEFRG